MKNIVIVLSLIVATLSTINFVFVRNSLSVVASDLISIEALAQSESYSCPDFVCNPGGCGSSSCSIEMSYPGGFGSTKSVTAQSGYYACCYKDWLGNTFANSYPNRCC